MAPPSGMDDGEDTTVRVRRPAAPVRAAARVLPRRGVLIAAALAAAAALGGGAALLLRPGPAPAPPGPAPAPAEPRIEARLADEAAILAHRGDALVVHRFAPSPAVLVLDFPALAAQARTLNRLAALAEKAGLPRDRVLDDAALDAAERAGGGTAETFYYGHNYTAADLARFFALADRQGLTLRPEEEWLRRLARQEGWLAPGAAGALLSLPRAGVEPWLDLRARAAILRHELSHGAFSTEPAYAALVRRFWREALTEAERARFRTALAAQSYDATDEEVMANEAQAFLFHTPDERFFAPATVGMGAERAAALRAWFRAAMPAGWLRDAMGR